MFTKPICFALKWLIWTETASHFVKTLFWDHLLKFDEIFQLKNVRFHSVYLEFMFFFYFSSKLSIISRICVRVLDIH